MRIYLTGFMTSGKSTIGPILANVLGLEFFDLDHEVEIEEKLTVVEIFEKHGEQYFRESEAKLLNKLSEIDNIVVSLGGGTITNKSNFEMMKSTGKIIYLKVSANTLLKRLKHKTDRPIFRDMVLGNYKEEEFLKRIRDLLEKRKELYERADIIIDTEITPLGQTIDRIAKNIKHVFHEKNRS
ncbi:MAG: shikimate kinase [Ignavibacteria bacterium]|nr:MAG: shikimate kinase [Ignavibacteria bacterium]KAF0156688.1 MAG: shikimate kinase [Ignavibacteria bacterium]